VLSSGDTPEEGVALVTGKPVFGSYG